MSNTDYDFTFEKSVHMYNHLLTIKHGGASYSAIIEDPPYGGKALLIWLEDFNLPDDCQYDVRPKLRKWFREQGYNCHFEKGRRV